MKPSITFITPGSHPIPSQDNTSVESSIMHIVPYLASIANVTVLGRKTADAPSKMKREGAFYFNFSTSKKKYIKEVAQYVAKKKPDVIQIENRPQYVLPLRKRMKKGKLILSLHSINFIKSAKNKLQQSLHKVDQIIVNSKYIKRYVVQRYPDLQKKIVVNYLGVDEQRFRPVDTDALQRLRTKDRNLHGFADQKVILYIGRLKRQKGVHNLIQSIPYLKQKYHHFVLVIVGGSHYGKNKSTKYVRKLYRLAKPYAEHVQFHPFAKHEQIHRWYRMADLVVVPSMHSEAFGLVNLEAMATGVPVIATKVGGIPEVIHNEEGGILIPPKKNKKILADTIYHIFADEKWSAKLGRDGRRRVEKQFTWKRVAASLYEIYFS